VLALAKTLWEDAGLREAMATKIMAAVVPFFVRQIPHEIKIEQMILFTCFG